MKDRGFSRALFVVAALALGGCASIPYPLFGSDEAEAWPAKRSEPAPRSASSSPPPAPPPAPTPPPDRTGAQLFATAMRAKGRRILISLEERWLWLMEGEEVLLAAPVAVGSGAVFTYEGRTFRFDTPRGHHRVLGKEENPIWTPPDWHYFEAAVQMGLTPVQLSKGQRVLLSDSTRIEVRGDQVGRVNLYGNFWPFTPGSEIIFDDKIFIPPFGTDQRRIPRTLGTHKIDLGDGYLIHGTYERDSIGSPVSHGCIRLRNEDVARLYEMVGRGSSVYIF